VDGDRTTPPAPGAEALRLVGRDLELARLRAWLDAALAGSGGLVLISGEAGIGKTALTHALALDATARGAVTLRGGCYDLAATPPYGPWRELAADAAARAHLPDLMAVLSEGAADGGQATLFDRVGAGLAAASRPAVLLLEDLHWADPGSLDLLRDVTRRARSLPLLVVATYRPEDVTRRHPLSPLIPLLVRESGADWIEPAPLAAPALAALIAARYDLPPPDAERLVAYLQRHTEGNPLFVGELLRTLETVGRLHPRGTGWALDNLEQLFVPSLLQQIIDARVDRLGEEVRQPLAIAATIGEEVPVDVWATVGELDDAAILAAVEQAVAANLLAASPDGTRVRFTHALIRAALYEGILPLRRRRWHLRAGEALAGRPGAEPDAVAYHLQQAADPRAVDWLIRAGDRAQRAYVWLTAADRFDAAQAMLVDLPDRARDRAWLLYRTGRLRRFSEPAAGIPLLEAAERLADNAGDPVLAAYARADRGALRCLMGDLRRGLVELTEGVAAIDRLPPDHAPPGSDEAAWVADALPSHDPRPPGPDAPAGPPAASPSGDVRRGTLAIWLATLGRYREAEALAVPLRARIAALPTAELPLRFAAGDAAFGLALAQAAMGRPDAARDAFRQAREPAQLTGHHFSLGWIAVRDLSQVVLPYFADRLDERRRLADEAESALARGAVGLMPSGLSPRRGLAPLLIVEGRWAEARRLAMEAHGQGTFFARQEAAASLAVVTALQGDHDLAWTQIREVFPDGPPGEPGGTIFHLALVLIRVAAELTLAAGDAAAARRWLTAHDQWLGWSGMVRDRPAGQLAWAAYHRLRGDRDGAQRAAAGAAAAAAAPRQPLLLAAARRVSGALAAEAGRAAEAERLLAESLALADACAAPYERALTLIELAAARLSAAPRRPEDIDPLLDEARALCRGLGAEPALARLGELANRSASAANPPANGASGLSARELDVLRLVADGLTDAEVGDRLSISPRTVGQHLRSIYGKLGVSSRAAATRLAVERNLL